MSASVTIKNSGRVRGTEVVRLYAAGTATGVILPAQQGPIEVSVGSGSSDIRQTANLDVSGKTRSIKGEERAFLSTATVGPAGI